MTPRGIRNNNPGNIRKSSDKWQGLASVQADPEFFTFTSPEMGIRALARILITYYDKYDLNTVDKLIHRWAPPSENSSQTYANAVAAEMGIATVMEFNVHAYYYLSRLVPAIIHHENGIQPYTKAQIDRGLALAGVLPDKPKSVASTSTVKASTVAVGGGAVTAGVGIIDQVAPNLYYVQPILEMIRDNGSTLAIVGGLCLVGLAGYIIYRRWDEHRRLVR